MSSTLYAALAATAFVVARPFAGAAFGSMAGSMGEWCGRLLGSGVQSATAPTTTKAHPNATGNNAGKRITPGALGGRT